MRMVPAAQGLEEQPDFDSSSGAFEHSSNGEYSVAEFSSVHGGSATDGRSRRVWYASHGVLVLLIAIAVGAPVLIFRYLVDGQVRSFEREFDELSSAIQDSFGLKLASTLSTTEQLSIGCTSYGQSNNVTWPFVTFPFFDYESQNGAALGQVLAVSYSPIITKENRMEWEAYTETQTWWIHEAIARQSEAARRLSGESDENTTFVPAKVKDGVLVNIYSIHPVTGERYIDTSSGPYIPSWQSYPLTTVGINYNFRGPPHFNPAADVSIANGEPVVAGMIVYVGQKYQRHAAYYSFLLKKSTGNPNATYNGEPTSLLYFPVYDSFESDRKIVGVITATLFWPFLFEDTLPTNNAPIYAIVTNTCNQVFSILIEGNEAMYLGLKDVHDESLEKYAVRFSLREIVEKTNFEFTGIANPLGDDHCPYTLTIYPTEELYERHMTNAPIFLSAFSSAFFVLVAVVLSSYSLVVKSRLKRIEKVARESGAIVSSLYPKEVRDRLLKRMREEKHHERSLGYSSGVNHALRLDDLFFSEQLTKTAIADLYANCTLFFAHLVNFDSWSLNREPESTFVFLETIFLALDRTCKKYRICKVETIADTYLAAAGIPRAQADHAVRMGRFAREAIELVEKLIANELTDKLGPEAGGVQIKVGLHSGPVTGGVLAGDKSRFCVFGDTVNWASRMASHGLPGRIHLSSATADILAEAGKEKWVTKRKEKVNLKGKGIMTTYWLGFQEPQLEMPTTSSSEARSSVLPDAHVTEMSNNEQTYLKQPKKSTLVGPSGFWNLYQDNESLLLVSPSDHLQDEPSPKADGAAAKATTQTLIKGPPSLTVIKEAEPEIDMLGRIVELFSIQINRPRKGDVTVSETLAEVSGQLRCFVHGIAKRPLNDHSLSHAVHATMSAMKLLSFLRVDSNACLDGLTIHQTQFAVLVATLASIVIDYSATEKARDIYLISIDSSIKTLIRHPRCAILCKYLFGEKPETKESFKNGVSYLYKVQIDGNEIQGDDRLSVLASIVRASRLAHSMQHWSVFIGWNEKKYVYKRHQPKDDPGEACDDSASSPEAWYNTELRLFDEQVVPLAKRLRDCGEFTSSIGDCLSFATSNHRRWAKEGLELAREMEECI